MEQFKIAKILMLATNKPSKIGNLATYQKRSLAKVIKEGINLKNSTVQFWNLYIISDDEIKENNTHFYNPHSGQLHISGNHTDYIAINKNGCKKIIATTDVSLGLPQPSEQFIQKYIEEYNKCNVITDVSVEYERDYTNRNCNTCNLGTNGTCELGLEKECCSNTKDDSNHKDYWLSCLNGEKDSEIYKLKIKGKQY